VESPITVRIAHARPWPGKVGDRRTLIAGYLVVLADDAGQRAIPVWLLHGDRAGGGSLPQLVDEPDGVTVTAGVPEELGARLLRAAGATVTGVNIEMTKADAGELTAETAAARIEVGGRAGSRQVTARLGLGLAVAAATGAPVRLDSAVLDRLAVPVPGDDPVGPILDRLSPGRRLTERRAPLAAGGASVGTHAGGPGAGTHARPRFEPRNLAFADGLDRWQLGFDVPGETAQPRAPGYTSAAEDGTAFLSAAVQEPGGSAALLQTIFADDYRGGPVVFSGEIRTEAVTQRAGLRLEILTRARPVKGERGDTEWEVWPGHEQRCATLSGSSDWARQEVTALVPDDAELIRFGITLTGPGVVALRSPELALGA
jgi:hypothetical protein